MAASGYVNYNETNETFGMGPEQCAVFANPDSPVALAGGYYSVASLYIDEPAVTKAFQTGEGLAWGDHHSCLFCGTEKFFRPGYSAHLVQEWIPALNGTREKLEEGAKVADVGCGHGCSTLIMAKAFPNSEFIGYDVHAPSIERARELAREQDLTNLRFEVSTAKEYQGKDYDLVTFFDCLHDMGDPAGAAAHVRSTLAPDGAWMIVEPRAGETLSQNLNPVGRLYYAFSTMVCTPASRGQEVGLALGAQAGERRLRQIICEVAGFTRFRRATETPFNLILEAKR
jgi:SAM-dependent methyltransferase